MTNPTATTEDRTLRLTCRFSAPPERVFTAYTDAEQQKAWYRILDDGITIVDITTDLRVGGQQHAVWGPDNDTLFHETRTFLEIDRPHRLVTDSTGTSPDGGTLEAHTELTFEPDGDGTLVSVTQTGLPTPEVRNLFATQVWKGVFDRLQTYLQR